MDAQRSDLCRLCLGSINGCDEILLNNNLFLIESICLITGLKVVSDSEQCEYLCGQCQSLLEQCVEFRLACINNDGVYREMVTCSNHVDDYKPELQEPVVEYVKTEPIDLEEADVPTLLEVLENNHMFGYEIVELPVERKGQSKNNKDDGNDLQKLEDNDFKKVQCQQSGTTMDHYDLKRNMEIHKSNKKKKYCPVCPKKYARSIDLTQHINAHHARESQFTCVECGKSYISRQSLNEHYSAVHNGDKRFACKFCGDRFTRASVRSKHQRTVHATARPVACTHCDKTFKTKSDLRSHIRYFALRKPQELVELSE